MTLRRPRSVAPAVPAKNSPQDCFLNAPTVLQEIKFYIVSFPRLPIIRSLVLYIDMNHKNVV